MAVVSICERVLAGDFYPVCFKHARGHTLYFLLQQFSSVFIYTLVAASSHNIYLDSLFFFLRILCFMPS